MKTIINGLKYSVALISVLFAVNAFGFADQPQLSVSLPSPPSETITIDDSEGDGEDYSVCGSGCDYANLDAFEDAQVGAGSLIKLKAGTYYIDSFGNSGSSGNEVVYQANGDGDVYIANRGTDGDPTYLNIAASYLIFDGGTDKELIFDGDSGSYDTTILRIDGSNVTFTNVIVEQIGGASYSSGGPYVSATVWIRNDNIKIYNSYIRDTNGIGVYHRDGDNFEFKNNYVYDVFSSGVQINPHETGTSGDDMFITGNIFRNVGKGRVRSGTVFLISAGSGVTISDPLIANNIYYDCYIGFKIDDQNAGTLSGFKIYNNTAVDCSSYGFRNRQSNVGDLRNNIAYGSGTADISEGSGASWSTDSDNYTGDATGSEPSVISDADFISATFSNDDFMVIDSDSEAATGTNSNLYSDVPIDFYGVERPNSTGMAAGATEIPSGGAGDSTDPFTSGWDPAKSATGVAIEDDIIVHVEDAGDGVDSSTIILDVEGVAYDCDDAVLTCSGTSADYTLTYTHDSWNYEQVINVEVDATDQADNAMTTDVYSFTCETAPAAEPLTISNIGSGGLTVTNEGSGGLTINGIQ